MAKQKCKCGHGKDIHAPKKGVEGYDGECCVIYRGENRELKSCYCTEYEDA